MIEKNDGVPSTPKGPDGSRPAAVPTADDRDPAAIASAFVPRLMLLNRTSMSGSVERHGGSSAFCDDQVAHLAALLSAGELRAADAFLDTLITDGLSRDAVLLDLLPTAAGWVGRLWETDEADFSDVTLALCNLHRIVRQRNWCDLAGARRHAAGPAARVTLCTLSGEQHTFGAALVAEMFRRAAWSVTVASGLPIQKLEGLLEAGSTDVLAISGTCGREEDAIRDEIARYRAAADPHGLTVVVGGPAFADPLAAVRCGADGWSVDAANAPVIAGRLFALAALRH